jgi:hypothetical protein
MVDRDEPIEALRIKPSKKTTNKSVSARERWVRSGKRTYIGVILMRTCIPVGSRLDLRQNLHVFLDERPKTASQQSVHVQTVSL